MNHYADMLNYEKPFTKVFQSITSDITKNIYITSHLNFNPANLFTYNGLFFENIVEETAYIYTTTEKQTIEINTEGCLIAIYFWMQNTLQHYERVYDRIRDILGNIGGISSIFVTFAYTINLLVNNFIILLDTSKFVSDIGKDNFNGTYIQGKPSIFQKSNEIMYPPRKLYATEKKQFNMNEEPISSNNKKLENSSKLYDEYKDTIKKNICLMI